MHEPVRHETRQVKPRTIARALNNASGVNTLQPRGERLQVRTLPVAASFKCRPRPGRGWEQNGRCYDHDSGLRITVGYAMCRLPSGDVINGELWPESRTVRHWIAVAGGNRRRGVMMWARTLELKCCAEDSET